MADKVKRGFAFYLMMLILILVAAFLVIVTIMLFSPQKVILGYKYFNFAGDSNNKVYVTTTDASKTSLNFSNINTINVDCQNARVEFVKIDSSAQASEVKDSIKVINNCVGFAKGEQNTDFVCTITNKSGVLDVTITEPEGFLFFSKDLAIIFQLPSTSTYQFQNTSINVNTTGGSVSFGSKRGLKEETELTSANSIILKNVNVTTKSGNIYFNKFCSSNISTLILSTVKGNIHSAIDLNVSSSAGITTKNGNVNLIGFTGSNLNLSLNNGNFNVDNLTATVNLIVASGKVSINKMTGDFGANETRNYIDKASISINSITGDVSIPFGNRSNINIKDINGQMNIITTSGNINVGGINKTCWLETLSGTINAVVEDDGTAGIKHSFNTTSGTINVNFAKAISSENNLNSKSGTVNFEVKSNYLFLLNARRTDGNFIEKLSNTVAFEFIDSAEYIMPFKMGNYSGSSNVINVSTDGAIYGKLIKIA